MIINGDSLDVLKRFESGSINCCITSPPYYQMRDYGVDGQIGLENTPAEYLQKLRVIFQEVYRVLRPDGTLWINIADSRCSTAPGSFGDPHFIKESSVEARQARKKYRGKTPYGMKPKDLIGIPWMLAFALRDDGWYLRQDIIWHKPNPMPEAVKDRCTTAHEYIFLLSKSRHYFYDYEAVKEPCVGFEDTSTAGNERTCKKGNRKSFRGGGAYVKNRSFNNSGSYKKTSIGNESNQTGLRNRRSVWTVSTKGYKGAHFATFPPDLVKPCILAGCPPNGVVLDPFGGSGTIGEVALKLGRDFICIELNPDYCQLAEQRIEAAMHTKI